MTTCWYCGAWITALEGLKVRCLTCWLRARMRHWADSDEYDWWMLINRDAVVDRLKLGLLA